MPDPAFHFETPRTTYRRLNGWFRGGRIMRNEWDRRFSTLREKMPKVAPSPLARYVAEQEQEHRPTSSTSAPGAAPTRCGSPGGACRRSGSTTPGARANAVRRARGRGGLALELGWMNLHELRSVLAWGAPVARFDGPTVVMASHLVDATDQRGLEALVAVRPDGAGRRRPVVRRLLRAGA